MLEKCANPACMEKFRNLRFGKVFVTEIEIDDQDRAAAHVRERRYYWLCSSCCRTMRVVVQKGKRIEVVPLHLDATAARAAS